MEIAKWNLWQTFRKDRGTPNWIKVYRNLLTNSEWCLLADAEKGQLLSMWIIAADKNGQIPDDARLIQKMAMLDEPPNLNKFIELGFVVTGRLPEGNQVVANRLPTGDQVVAQSRVEESRVEKKEKKPRSNCEQFSPPSIQEIREYCQQRGNQIDAEQFHAFYESKGWKVGNQKMKSWQSAIVTWEKRLKEKQQAMPGSTGNHPSYKEWQGHG